MFQVKHGCFMAGQEGQSKGKKKTSCARCHIAQRRKSHRYCITCGNEYMKEWRKSHPLTEQQQIKANVRHKTKMRIQRGLLVPYPCEVCDDIKREAHHDDYRKPYCVRWLCRIHHLEHHAKERELK